MKACNITVAFILMSVGWYIVLYTGDSSGCSKLCVIIVSYFSWTCQTHGHFGLAFRHNCHFLIYKAGSQWWLSMMYKKMDFDIWEIPWRFMKRCHCNTTEVTGWPCLPSMHLSVRVNVDAKTHCVQSFEAWRLYMHFLNIFHVNTMGKCESTSIIWPVSKSSERNLLSKSMYL